MTHLPIGQTCGIAAKLATSAGLSFATTSLYDRPVIGILMGAVVLIPLASCLEDVLQLLEGRKKSLQSTANSRQQVAYPQAPGLAHTTFR